MYANSFLAFVTNGKFIRGEEIASIAIKPIADRVLTRHRVTKVWQIFKFPYKFDFELIEQLKSDMRERYPDVLLVFQLINEPIALNIEHNTFVSQRNGAIDTYEKFKAAFESLRETDRAVGIKYTNEMGWKLSFSQKDVDEKKQMVDSYVKSSEAVQNGHAVVYTHLFVYAQALDNKAMNQFATSFRLELMKLKLKFKPVGSLLNNFLENYGPASYISANSMGFQQAYLFSENVTHILPTKSEGLVNTEGVLLGVNINNGLPFLLEFFKSGSGQTVMIAAQTGWGKTHLAFGFVLGLLSDNVHVSVTDLKGEEWNRIGQYTRFEEISLGGANPRSVNTLRLDDMLATRDDCVYIYNSAIAATVRVLSLMSTVSNNEYKGDLEKALESAIIALYNAHKVVKENPDTFVNTRDLKYEDVLPYLAEIESTGSSPQVVREICNLARFRCESVLKGSSTLAESFKNEISVQEIIDVPLVIYSLNKNTDHDLTVGETIAVFMAEYLSTKKHHYRKRLGLHSALFAEEVQRYQDGSEIVAFLSNQTTGARSQNVMIVFLLNSIAKLVGPTFAPIKSNVSTAIVGLLAEADIEMMDKEFGFHNIIPDLTEIFRHQQEYSNAFAISFNTGYQYGNSLIRAMLPKDMNQSLATRTIRTGD